MRRRLGLVLLPLIMAIAPLSGCRPRASTLSEAQTPTPLAASDEWASDPLVSAAVRAFDATSSPAESGAIVGYRIDWQKNTDNGFMTVELVVKPDGSLYVPAQPSLVGPEGKHGRRAPKRIGPESGHAAAARKHALDLATNEIERTLPELKDADVDVFSYLVRIVRTDGVHVDLWVSPDDPMSARPTYPLKPWNPSRLRPLPSLSDKQDPS